MRTFRLFWILGATAPFAIAAFVACSDNALTPAVDAGADSTAPENDASAQDTGVADANDAATFTCTVSPCVIEVSAGFQHACAVLSDKTVRCWGGNYSGQTGQPVGGGGPILKPTVVTGIGPATHVSAASTHSCALLEDNSVWCWGDNQYAQLAIPTDGGPNAFPTPQKVTLAKPVKQLVSSGFSTCALFTDGTLSCWGMNTLGQTGTGTEGSAYDASAIQWTPTTSAGGVTNAVEIGLGWRFVCARLQNGSVSCFGNNYDGQLGRGPDAGLTDLTVHSLAAPVVGLPTAATRVPKSTGYHEAVLLANGEAWTWGTNSRGNLGIGADAGTVSQPTPLKIPGVTGALDIAPANIFTCALTSGHQVACWGARDFGELGLVPDGGPEAGTNQYDPVVVQGLSNVAQISTGWYYFACALENGGALKCWGNNATGQLGRQLDAATLQYDPTPAAVAF